MLLNIWVNYMKKRSKKSKQILRTLVYVVVILLCAYFNFGEEKEIESNAKNDVIYYELSSIPEYSGEIYIEVNNNIPRFTAEDMNLEEDYYSDLVNEKVGMAMVKTSWKKSKADNIKDDYSSITPTGFKQKKYSSSVIPGGYLYNRCHLIAWMLGGVDVDERNLMTGTRDFNIKGMKYFEDIVYDYLEENKENHVMYRVTPYFETDNSLASGVNIEAYSIEDNGDLSFNVYVYNVQDKIVIDYATGESELEK